MSALEELAQAALDGRIHFTVETSTTSPFGVPTGATFYLDIDPPDDNTGDLEDQT